MARHKIVKWSSLLSSEEAYSSAGKELVKKWKVADGQLWSLGKHKLYVGDAQTKKAHRAIGAHDVEGVCTDPPYDMDIVMVAQIIGKYADRAVVLGSDNIAHGLTSLWKMRLNLVWIHDEPRSIPTNKRPLYYHNQIVIITKDENVQSGWIRPRPDFSSVIYAGTVGYYRSKDFIGHIKVPFVFQEMLAGFKWKVFVDPFVGYGTTFIAAENTGKVCLGIEINPEAAAVTLERMKRIGLCQPKKL